MVLANNGLKNKESNYKFVLGRVDSITVINKKIYETKRVNQNFKFGKNKEEKNTPKDIHNVYNSGKLDILQYGIKLIDFGCSKIFNRTKRNFNDNVGTLVYCSPEVLSNNYNYSCDIWASGVIMYILLAGIYPFYGETEEEITKNIITGKFSFDTDKFNGISEEAKDLIKKCFILDPNKRINIIEALNHPFFDDLKDSKIILEDEKKILSNLKNKPISPKFYQIVLTYMSYHFDDKEILSELSRMFYKIDKDSDGKISKTDLYIVYNEAGEKLSKKELQKIIDSVDFDKNGYIEYEEFIRVLIPEEKLFTEQNLRNAFALFDVEKNGFITPTQIIDVLLKDEIISEKVKTMLKNEIIDFGDEIIEFEEFKNMMLTLSIQ
jgi:calcium-dependent protein kinase